ncbi:MAG TPA: DUF6569 family protein [Solirubrobacteraceae bacterium]
MTTPALAPTTIDYLEAPLRLGEADVAGPLAVFPIFGPEPRLAYRSFAQAAPLGATVAETAGHASVNDLVVTNPTDLPVLLYEGEEVLGAQQNRTFDVSVLVPAGAKLTVPVSCVEHGRWDGTRHAEALSPAPQAAYPQLRRQKSAALRASVAQGHAMRADQGEVWAEVAAKSDRMSAASPTGAMHDIYEHRRSSLDDMIGAVRLHAGQLGALAAIGGRCVVLDHASRPDVFAALHAPLLQGYALDALEATNHAAPSPEEADAFVAQVLHARLGERDGIGLGRSAQFATPAVAGTALLAERELVQLTAFGEDGGHGRTRIRRPSRRR